MPKVKVANYENAVIYKVVKDDELVYVGSTTQPLGARWGGHIYEAARGGKSQLTLDMASRGLTNFSCVEVEKYPCANRTELEARERWWVEKLHPTKNVNLVGVKKVYPTVMCSCGHRVVGSPVGLGKHILTRWHVEAMDNDAERCVRFLYSGWPSGPRTPENVIRAV
jgi:hypothetical protein